MTLDQIAQFLAIVGCPFLFLWWLRHARSGRRGFNLALIGVCVILAAVWHKQLLDFIPVLVRIAVPTLVIFSLFVLIVGLVWTSHLRTLTPQEQDNTTFRAACSECHRLGTLSECHRLGTLAEYSVQDGVDRTITRLCRDCAKRCRAVRLRAQRGATRR